MSSRALESKKRPNNNNKYNLYFIFYFIFFLDQLFNLRFTSKQLAKMSTKSEKKAKLEQGKVKKAIEQGNMEGARIYAQNAIREKNLALNYLRLSSRVDAVASRVETAVRMQNVTRAMAGVVKGMDAAMQSMDLNRISQVMDQFEKQFEDMDVQSEFMENAMGQTTSLTTPASEVDSLIQQVADEHGLELGETMGAIPSGMPAMAQPAASEQDELSARLDRLKAKSN